MRSDNPANAALQCNSGDPSPDGEENSARVVFGRCPTHWLFRQLADRWTFPVLSVLLVSPCRFSDLREQLRPISARMLGRTLKKLVQIGFVERRRLGASSAVLYELTELGRSIFPPLERLLRWSRDAFSEIEDGVGSRRRQG